MPRMRSFSQPLKYGYASGRVKVLERTLLQKQHMDRLVDADFDECKRILMETDYGPFLADARVAKDVEDGLQDYLAGVYAFFRDPLIPSWLEEFFLCRYDLHNLRLLLKEKYFGGEREEALLPFGRVEKGILRAAVDGEEWNRLPRWLGEAAERAASAARDKADPQLVDVIMDRAFLEYRASLASGEKSPVVKEFCTMTIDLANIKTALRCEYLEKPAWLAELALAEGGSLDRNRLLASVGKGVEALVQAVSRRRYVEFLAEHVDLAEKRVRLTNFDRAADDFILEHIKQARLAAAGPETVIGYIFAKENEIVALRIILMGKLHALTPEEIDRRLRGVYTQ
jgi:V/A-type H+-transporting ATPase subunit C